MAKPTLEKTYQEILNTKAQASKTYSEVIALKQNHFQKFLPSYISGLSLITSFVLGYCASRWAFNAQVKLEDKKKVKEHEFKNIDIAQKNIEEHRKIYMEASKYQPGILMSSRAASLVRISIECMARKSVISGEDQGLVQFYLDQMEQQKQTFVEHNNVYATDLKNYIAALAGYKVLKNGNTQINPHIEKMINGIDFEINSTLLASLGMNGDVDKFMTEEKARFNAYWQTHIKTETTNALDIILNNK